MLGKDNNQYILINIFLDIRYKNSQTGQSKGLSS